MKKGRSKTYLVVCNNKLCDGINKSLIGILPNLLWLFTWWSRLGRGFTPRIAIPVYGTLGWFCCNWDLEFIASFNPKVYVICEEMGTESACASLETESNNLMLIIFGMEVSVKAKLSIESLTQMMTTYWQNTQAFLPFVFWKNVQTSRARSSSVLYVHGH